MSDGLEASATPRAKGAAIGFLAALFIGLLWRTWGQWPDAMVDFGRELYTPWRITAGDALFVDIAWFNGPLSPYWNALWFWIFGAHLLTLVWVNVALFAATLALLHVVVRRFSSWAAATGACAVVLACCGFAQLVGIGNYNYICPYSHEATHGVLLTLGALWAAGAWAERSASRWSGLTGVFVGLAFLTKPEMFLAALAGGLGGLLLHSRGARTPRRERSLALFSFSVGLLLPVAFAYVLLALAMPAEAAQRGVLGAWPSLLSSHVSELAFYRVGMGLDAPGRNALAMLSWAAGWGALVAVVSAPAWLLRKRGATPLALWATALLAAGAVLGLANVVRLADAARAWPLFVVATLAAAVVGLVRRPGARREAGAAAFALVALALLAKMALNARLSHYGFALAMPATALLAAGLIHAWPTQLAQRGANAAIARVAAYGLLMAFAGLQVNATLRLQTRKLDSLGAGADRFTADARARALGAALEWLESSKRDGEPRTLAVFPEGVMLNYLARMPNPTPYVNFMPPELLLFGEDQMLAAFRASPPDVVVITHKSTAEYGFPWFGVHYAKELGAWLRENYRAVQVFGDPPLQPNSRFGCAVLVRQP